MKKKIWIPIILIAVLVLCSGATVFAHGHCRGACNQRNTSVSCAYEDLDGDGICDHWGQKTGDGYGCHGHDRCSRMTE
ncbi:MAG: hypothetical protein KHZ62_10130 [Clostridiales bacterium]|nr:hypothetical protein [Clostridiales bacterium]